MIFFTKKGSASPFVPRSPERIVQSECACQMSLYHVLSANDYVKNSGAGEY